MSVVENRELLYNLLGDLRDSERVSMDARALASKLYAYMGSEKEPYMYLSISEDKGLPYISYSKTGESVLDVKKRTYTKIGRLLYKLFEAEGKVISEITEWICAVYSVKPDEFKLLTGEAITKAYRDEIGGHSCMTESASKYTQVYADNSEIVRLLVHESLDGKTGRALLWITDQGVTAMDRVYPSSGTIPQLFRQWAQENKVVCPYYDDMHQLSVTLKPSSNGHYPYMDTFRYAWQEVGICHHIVLATESDYNKLPGIDWCYDGYMDSQYGGPFECDEEMCCCEFCEEMFHEDDIRFVDDRYVCENCIDEHYSSCVDCGELHRYDYMTSDVDSDLWCENCASENLSECDHCGDMEQNDNIYYADDAIFCKTCFDNLCAECKECGDGHKKSELYEHENGDYYCDHCMEHVPDENQAEIPF